MARFVREVSARAFHRNGVGCDRHRLAVHAEDRRSTVSQRAPAASGSWEPQGRRIYEHLEALRKKMQTASRSHDSPVWRLVRLSIAVTRAARSPEQMKQCVGDYIEKMKHELQQPQLSGDKEVAPADAIT